MLHLSVIIALTVGLILRKIAVYIVLVVQDKSASGNATIASSPRDHKKIGAINGQRTRSEWRGNCYANLDEIMDPVKGCLNAVLLQTVQQQRTVPISTATNTFYLDQYPSPASS